ncbi:MULTISPECIES: MFS transporter [unclassified Nocardia]|uniref:MFS transporter n=1 Tax=unclassified Nocardia TaxID=2637762 RepID=UPI001CE3BF1D|nr:MULTISPECIES: MFS transporter [unclassified Nocardia]
MSIPASAAPGPKRAVILLLALACGVMVADVYFPQALAPLIATELHIDPRTAALVVTATQIGYAVGVFLLVPLGDRLPYRSLLTALPLLTCAGLLVAAAAPTAAVLLPAAALVGVTTVVPQLIIPMAAGLVAPERRGAITGTLLSGLIAGILLARTFSGAIGEWAGWRVPYVVAAVAILLLTLMLRRVVPANEPASRLKYPVLVRQSLRLLGTETELRRSALYQFTVFGAFSAAWTSLALYLTGPEYRLGTSVVGLIALVGAGSVFVTPRAGRLADRRGSDRVSLLAFLGVLLSAAILWTGGLHGVAGIAGLAAGMLLLDIATQAGQVANQARIFALAPEIRSRLNTAYMTCAFLGGSLGSWLGVQVYDAFGWSGVCALVAMAAIAALIRHAAHMLSRIPGNPAPRTVPATGNTAGEPIDA